MSPVFHVSARLTITLLQILVVDKMLSIFTPQPLRTVGVLFSPMVGGRREKVCPACISETIRCRKLIHCRDIS